MQHQNSVFRAVLKQVPWDLFEKLVDELRADFRVRSLPTKTQLIALLYGQLSGASGLREIIGALESHESRLYHLGASPVARSTLSDANRLRPPAVFDGLLGLLIGRVHRKLRRDLDGTTYLIDSTGLRLSGLSDWARFSTGVCGVKAHVVYDPHADCPVYLAVTPANVNDITAAKAMPIEAGATYVFDLGYYDYPWWAELDAAGCRIVTRFKTNTPLTLIEDLPVPKDSNILSDRIGFLPARQAGRRKNPMSDAVREIRVRMDNGKELRLLSNDLDAPAQQIAELYKRRWAIELFFRWVKQTLQITRFVGRSENAIRIHIAVALIAFLLLRLAQAAQTAVESPLAFARLVRINLMQRRRIDALNKRPPPCAPNPDQGVFQWA